MAMSTVASTPGTRARKGGFRWADWEGYAFVSPWLLGLVLFGVVPFFASLYLSFTKYELLGAPEWTGLANYRRLFLEDPRFWISLKVTLYYSVLAVPTGLVIAFILALFLNADIVARPLFRTMFYLPSVTAGVATAFLWAYLLNPTNGLVNTLLSLVGIKGPGWIYSRQWAVPALVMMSWWGAGGTIIIYLAGLQAVPQHLYEAAEIDGASSWGRLRHVTIPMMSPTIFFTMVMGVIGSFQMFTTAYVITNGGPADATLFYILYLFRQAFQNFNMGYASALAWVLFVIVLGITLGQLKLSGRWVYYEG
jgi:multiple sugar transport system permease protein